MLRSVTFGEAAAPGQGCIYKYIYSSLYFDGGFKVLSCNPGELGFNRDLHKAALIVRPSERAIVWGLKNECLVQPLKNLQATSSVMA